LKKFLEFLKKRREILGLKKALSSIMNLENKGNFNYWANLCNLGPDAINIVSLFFPRSVAIWPVLLSNLTARHNEYLKEISLFRAARKDPRNFCQRKISG